jgi:uncharacterized protein (DUF924 family)
LSAGEKIEPADVIRFWSEAGPESWFRKNAEFDRAIEERFGRLHAEAARGERDDWAKTPEGALALVLLLDQFSRNMLRGKPEAFAQDEKAREIANAALAAGFDAKVPPELRQFLYLPLMHSEAIADQERCVQLFHGLPTHGGLPFARDHERIIRRFGRFPHRNVTLGRHATPAEQVFLESGGFPG